MMERTTLKMVARFRRMGFLLGGVAIFMLVASCTLNTSPGTSSSGPVVISTDHSVYATTESIQVTVTNHLKVDIYAFDHRASCSILGLEVQAQGKWQGSNSPGAECSLGRLAMQVRIASGHSYTATIQASVPGFDNATFFPGLYRLTFQYSTVATENLAVFVQSSSTISSATFAIQGSGPPPSPHPTYGGTPVRLPLPTIGATPVLPPSPTTK